MNNGSSLHLNRIELAPPKKINITLDVVFMSAHHVLQLLNFLPYYFV